MTREEFMDKIFCMLKRVHATEGKIVEALILTYDMGFEDGMNNLTDREAYRRGYTSGYYYRRYIEEEDSNERTSPW